MVEVCCDEMSERGCEMLNKTTRADPARVVSSRRRHASPPGVLSMGEGIRKED